MGNSSSPLMLRLLIGSKQIIQIVLPSCPLQGFPDATDQSSRNFFHGIGFSPLTGCALYRLSALKSGTTIKVFFPPERLEGKRDCSGERFGYGTIIDQKRG
jgi:hypothetical protein